MPKRIIVFLLVNGFFCYSQAQLKWENVDSIFGPLPQSLHVFKFSDSLEGRPLLAYYVSARLKDMGLLFTAQTGRGKSFTPSQYYLQEKSPLVIVNASFSSRETSQNLGMVMRNGKLISYNIVSLRGIGNDSVLYYYPTRSALGIDKKRRADVAWIFTDSSRHKPYAFEYNPVLAKGENENPQINDLDDVEWKWWKMQTAVGGGPTLIHEGGIMITNKEEQLLVGKENEKQPRTAMGYTENGYLIILVIQGKSPGISDGASLIQEAKILKGLGCYKALNLSGGGSSCMLVNGKETIKPSDIEGERPVPSIFLIKRGEIPK
jgi:hypothetical protein